MCTNIMCTYCPQTGGLNDIALCPVFLSLEIDPGKLISNRNIRLFKYKNVSMPSEKRPDKQITIVET